MAAPEGALPKTFSVSADKPLALPDELSYIISAFQPSEPHTSRSKAILVLSAFCQGVRSSFSGGQKPVSDNAPTESLGKVFLPLLSAKLADTTKEGYVVTASFLSSLFQVDWQSAAYIFQQDGVIDYITDAIDIFPSQDACLETSRLLSQAAGHKTCRSLITEDLVQWLETSCRSSNPDLRASSAIAVVKLSRGQSSDSTEATGQAEAHLTTSNDGDLTNLFTKLIISEEKDLSSISDAVEGLAYLSSNSSVKEHISKDRNFLTKLFSLVSKRKESPPSQLSSLIFGIVTIAHNLSTYRPRLSQEDAQIDKLRRMAKAGNKKGAAEESDPLDDDVHVKTRARTLAATGVLDVLALASRLNSQGIRATTGRTYLNIAEDTENRGRMLQSGASKSLMNLVKPSADSKAETLDPLDLFAVQALAKLSITASPVQVYGPNIGTVFDAIRPLAQMLLHDSATLLQRFESLMALTNISSCSPECAMRVGSFKDLLNKVELLLLEDHTLVRRASMELICNLIAGSDEVFERYGGSEDLKAGRSKLQVVVAMADVEDLQTRLAASGALAILSDSPSACRSLFDLQVERHRLFSILGQLIAPDTDAEDNSSLADPGLIHRGVVCFRNLFLNPQESLPPDAVLKEAEEADTTQTLIRLLKGEFGSVDAAVAKPAMEALNYLIEVKKKVPKNDN